MIIGVAVKFNGAVGKNEIRLPRPNRHVDCFKYAKSKLAIDSIYCISSDDQGFYTDAGIYLNRKDAMSHVIESGQKIYPDSDGDINRSPYLMSEDVWPVEAKKQKGIILKLLKKLTVKKFIGYFIMASIFLGMFGFTSLAVGYERALYIFGSSILLTAVVYFAVGLILSDEPSTERNDG